MGETSAFSHEIQRLLRCTLVQYWIRQNWSVVDMIQWLMVWLISNMILRAWRWTKNDSAFRCFNHFIWLVRLNKMMVLSHLMNWSVNGWTCQYFLWIQSLIESLDNISIMNYWIDPSIVFIDKVDLDIWFFLQTVKFGNVLSYKLAVGLDWKGSVSWLWQFSYM